MKTENEKTGGRENGTEELSREQNVVLFVLGHIEELKNLGVIEGGMASLDDRGRAIFERLKAENFTPTQEEINYAFRAIQSGGKKS